MPKTRDRNLESTGKLLFYFLCPTFFRNSLNDDDGTQSKIKITIFITGAGRAGLKFASLSSIGFTSTPPTSSSLSRACNVGRHLNVNFSEHFLKLRPLKIKLKKEF